MIFDPVDPHTPGPFALDNCVRVRHRCVRHGETEEWTAEGIILRPALRIRIPNVKGAEIPIEFSAVLIPDDSPRDYSGPTVTATASLKSVENGYATYEVSVVNP